MLSVQKCLYPTIQYSSGCLCNGTILRYAPKCNGYRTVDRRYAQQVPEKFLITEEDVKRFKIHPTVKKFGSSLLYSDYIEEKSLKLGHKRNMVEIAKMKKRLKDRCHQDLVEKPALSLALKYMKEAEKTSDEPKEDKDCTSKAESLKLDECRTNDGSMVFRKSGKPIHMPYAATDKYDTLKDFVEPEVKLEMPELNEKYKALYEKYLESKETELNNEIVTQSLTDKEEKKGQSIGEESESVPLQNLTKVPSNWMTDYEQYNDRSVGSKSWKSNYGTPNPNVPVSSVPCGGCGALLHCKDPAIPGYLPSELFRKQEIPILKSCTCQRCHFLKHYNTTLEVTVAPEEYPELLGHLKKKKVAVILMVDLMDFPCSIWPGVMDIIGKTTQVYVVGNKVDLLPNDGPNFLKRVEASLVKSLHEMGVGKANIKAVNLISAKTGYGVENLINKLQEIWGYKGDVYMLGCTNVGKSSLFNALIQSDYCKVQAVDLIQRATTSPWPGTTLRLLKFPILNPVRWRLYERYKRLSAEREGEAVHREFNRAQFWESKKLKYLTLQGRIGTTFERKRKEGNGFIGHDPRISPTGYLGLNETTDDYKESRWFYDTPGTMHPDQILNFLTTEELMLALPQRIISPRSFTINHNFTLFVAGLGRLDHIGGYESMKCTVFASHRLPVTVCRSDMADTIYNEFIKTEAFIVPTNDPERLKVFPALNSKELTVTGIGRNESAADVILSSIGWVAITVERDEEVTLRAWTPEGKGIFLRTPAMLSRSIALRGPKIARSAGYKRGNQAYSKK